MKHFVSKILLLSLLCSNLCTLASATEIEQAEKAFKKESNYQFHGHAEITEQQQKRKEIFTGETEALSPRRVINMTVSQVLSSGYSEEGDEFFAEISNEVLSEKGVLLPIGTIAHGKIKYLEDSKRMGRDGWIEVAFDYLITPDGREIPIEGKMSTKMHPVKGVTKNVVESAGYTAAGGLVGGYLALNLLGLETAIASQGYSVAGGAGIGAAVGLGMALYRKGKDVLISPGDEIKVKILTSVDLPIIDAKAILQDEIKYDGLNVRITNISVEKDPFGEENTITLSLAIENMTKKNFSSFDVALQNEAQKTFYQSIFAENNLNFIQLKPGDRISGKMSFSVDNPKRQHWLVFNDRQTRKPLAKISIDNAKREIEIRDKNKKGKKSKRNNNDI